MVYKHQVKNMTDEAVFQKYISKTARSDEPMTARFLICPMFIFFGKIYVTANVRESHNKGVSNNVKR